jgi:uncharacterized membrane protein YfcA
MIDIFLIAGSFALGFFFESIFGFGGGLIAYSILGFFIDFKLAILAGFYVGTLSSLYIAFTSYKNIEFKIFKKLILISLIGASLGSYFFSNFPVKIIAPVFGLLLIFIGIKTLFFDKKNSDNNQILISKKSQFIKFKLLMIASLAQGAFGTGGPFVVNALKKDFKNKSTLRATMSLFFLFCNLLRFPQLIISKDFNLDLLGKIWWIIIPVYLAIFLGYKVHLKINENYFKKGIGIITLIAGFKFLLT